MTDQFKNRFAKISYLILTLMGLVFAVSIITGEAAGETGTVEAAHFDSVISASSVRVQNVPKPKVLMILLNRVGLEDISGGKYKNIHQLLSMGSLGLMTVNTAGGFTDVNAYVTMGGGDRLLGDPKTGAAYNRDETLSDGATGADIYRRNIGNLLEHAEILNTAVPSVFDTNKERYTTGMPGQLGAILHQHGLKTALVGNSDLGQEDPPNRIGASIVMDDMGRIDYGDVSRKLLKKDPSFPYGWRTDYEKVLSTVNHVWEKSDFIVVETGDSIRANAEGSQQFKKMKEQHRQNAIEEADAFIGRILPKIGKDVLVMLVTPLPQDDLLKDGIRLAPIIMAGGNMEKGGIITSPSTRQKGLITNSDISATIASHLNIANVEALVGQAAVGTHTKLENISQISELYSKLNGITKFRNLVLYYYTRSQWVFFGAMLLLITFGNLRKLPSGTFEKSLMKTILFLPLIILLTAAMPVLNVYLNMVVVLAGAVVAGYLCSRNKNDDILFMTAALTSVLICVGDVLFGGPLMKKAALSYDMVAGGRFYGIGNEYMGVVIGAAILGFSAWLHLKPALKNKIMTAAIGGFGLLVLFFAAPYAGTNAGGTIAAVIGFVSAAYFFSGEKISLKTSALTAAAMAGGFGILITMNFAAPVNVSSHIGRSLDILIMGDMEVIQQTIMRKLEANLYLLRNSPFSVILIMQLLILAALLIKENKRLLEWGKKEYYLSAGFAGMVIGSLAAFVFNDSGVIASAMMNNFLIIPLLLKLRGSETGVSLEGQTDG